MKTKDESLNWFKQFIADVGKPRTIVTDGAKEYNSKAWNDFCRDNGIRHEVSAPYIPEDNGKIERTWGTIVGMSRCMLEQARMPKTFWTHALRVAFYVKNRCVHSSHGRTPCELMYGTPPDLSNLRVFGCKAFVHVERDRKKLDARASEGVFLGYSGNANAYIVSVPDQFGCMPLQQSRSVTFDETTYFFNSPSNTVQPAAPPLDPDWSPDMSEDVTDDSGGEVTGTFPTPQLPLLCDNRTTADGHTTTTAANHEPSANDELRAELQDVEAEASDSEVAVDPPTDVVDLDPEEENNQRRTRGNGRLRATTHRPAHLNDFLDVDELNLSLAAAGDAMVPESTAEALQDPNW